MEAFTAIGHVIATAWLALALLALASSCLKN
jgi:hypothetical protein